MSYERLIREHDEIDALARKLGAAAEGIPDTQRVAELLRDLSTIVREHLRHEDRSVYQPLLDAQADGKTAPPKDFEGMFEDLRSDWEHYLGTWNSETIAADWPKFTQETRTMMQRLCERVHAETNLIYPAALQHGAIRLREHPAVA